MDVGAGSGAGGVALARRFPGADVVAVDKSADMLARTLEAAEGHGLDGRVRAVQADLDRTWSDLENVGLIWASSSLHELANPERSLREMFAALEPRGVLVVVEMDGLPRFLPDNFHEGLEPRLHAALSQQGWNAHPDRRPALERAGFAAVEQRAFPTVARPASDLAFRYARRFLERVGPSLEGIATTDDLDALKRLLADDGEDAPLRNPDLQVRGSRTAWAGRKT